MFWRFGEALKSASKANRINRQEQTQLIGSSKSLVLFEIFSSPFHLQDTKNENKHSNHHSYLGGESMSLSIFSMCSYISFNTHHAVAYRKDLGSLHSRTLPAHLLAPSSWPPIPDLSLEVHLKLSLLLGVFPCCSKTELKCPVAREHIFVHKVWIILDNCILSCNCKLFRNTMSKLCPFIAHGAQVQ